MMMGNFSRQRKNISDGFNMKIYHLTIPTGKEVTIKLQIKGADCDQAVWLLQ